MPLYPLLLDPIYKEKVWGGRSLERFGRTLPGSPETGIGESWEVADLSATSPSGGGGGAAHTRIRNGPLMKRPLREAIREFGELITGRLALGADGSFPLLVKYLDAREDLSVQVHPSPAYAEAHTDAHLKSEAWYIVDADPDAVIYKGVREGTTPEDFGAAIRAGTVPDLLISVPARAGDCHYLPSGTCHALGAGILVAEVQTASDTTFRVFDWGRTDRELHVDAALECIEFGPSRGGDNEPGTRVVLDDAVSRHLVDCEHFSIRELRVPREADLVVESDELSILMIISGECVVRWGSESPNEILLRAGNTVLIPAGLARAVFSARSDLKALEIVPPATNG